MAQPILQVQDLIKSFGGVTATANVSLETFEGEVHAIIGPNGAGKAQPQSADNTPPWLPVWSPLGRNELLR